MLTSVHNKEAANKKSIEDTYQHLFQKLQQEQHAHLQAFPTAVNIRKQNLYVLEKNYNDTIRMAGFMIAKRYDNTS